MSPTSTSVDATTPAYGAVMIVKLFDVEASPALAIAAAVCSCAAR
jgi:hypothetical protein